MSDVRLSQAYAALGLSGPADDDALVRAFRASVKAARPDLPGGDPERFRQVIAAYRLIQKQGSVQPNIAVTVLGKASSPVVGVTPLQALRGGLCELRLGARTLRVRVAAGVRTGDRLRICKAADDGADLHLPVLIRAAEGLTVLGDDLHMTWPTPMRLLEEGGRIEIETHAGPRSAWVTEGLTAPVKLRLRDLGLPARGQHPTGHLFVTLDPCVDAPSAAEDMLARFTRVWTAERMAA